MLKYDFSLLDGCAISVALTVTLLLRRLSKRSRLSLPPGPPRYPIVGNLFQIPTTYLWEKACEWAKTYGDMVFIDAAGVPMLFINSHEIAVDLFNKRSSNYSTRPEFVMPTLGGWKWTTPLMPYGEELRKHRMYLQKFYQTPNVLNYLEVQQKNCNVFLQSMLEHPEHYEEHMGRLPAAVLMMNTYGHQVENENDRYVKLGQDCVRASAGTADYFFLDLLPWLRHLPEWFPGAKFHTVAREARDLSHIYKNEIYALSKKKLLDGTAKECMTTIFLGENGQEGGVKDEKEFVDVAATVFLAGQETSSTALMNLVLAMLKYPEIQRRAQEEIDRVIGRDRLPAFEDRENLPYIKALCSEVLRWQVILPFGLPHVSSQDDVYRGYHIPAGTMVMANLWGISQDSRLYPDPLEFKPERWLPGGCNHDSLRPEEYVFGYGRRICTGEVWADNLLYIATVTLLAAFNIEPALDPNGVPIPPNERHKSSVIRIIGPSQCNITPRSEKHVSLIRDLEVA
ncbi:CyP450 monooxygenase [Schizopora paradoxa]|uniref:CyP450 monooxygenase n=1 Tax=Schizopora paradoxa TaxID=27342 RepID=A0A0H2RSY5_9AGAM|nr:CyP450 monooxygenase [Schizopora paradoxa]